jgi:hypothetical protein
MIGRRSALVGVIAVAATVGGGAAFAATHGVPRAHARQPVVKRFHAPRVEPKNHFCHPGKKGSEYDSLLN